MKQYSIFLTIILCYSCMKRSLSNFRCRYRGTYCQDWSYAIFKTSARLVMWMSISTKRQSSSLQYNIISIEAHWLRCRVKKLIRLRTELYVSLFYKNCEYVCIETYCILNRAVQIYYLHAIASVLAFSFKAAIMKERYSLLHCDKIDASY